MSPAKNQDSGTRQERARLLAAKAKQMDPVVEEEKEDKVTRFSARLCDAVFTIEFLGVDFSYCICFNACLQFGKSCFWKTLHGMNFITDRTL
jgi:hypothetical protein